VHWRRPVCPRSRRSSEEVRGVGEPDRSGRLPVGTLAAVSINNSVPILTNDHSFSFRRRTRRSH
jgi:hypothetical protein